MRPIWFAAIAVGAGCLGGVGWWASRVWAPGGAPPSQHVQSAPEPPRFDAAAARQAVDGQLQTKEYAGFFDSLRQTFPADYGQSVDRFVARVVATGQVDSPDAYFTEAYRALRQTRGVVAAKASPAPLTRVFDAEAALLKALGETDAHLCVDFIYGGATQAYFAFAAKHRGAVAELGEAGLAGIVDGQSHKTDRVTPTDADMDRLEKALTARGLNKAEIGVLIDNRSPDPPIADARICAIEQIYLATLKSLPEDSRWRIYRLAVELMARS